MDIFSRALLFIASAMPWASLSSAAAASVGGMPDGPADRVDMRVSGLLEHATEQHTKVLESIAELERKGYELDHEVRSLRMQAARLQVIKQALHKHLNPEEPAPF